MKVTLGKTYEGIGNSILTFGKTIKGRLTEFHAPNNHAVLICEKREFPCNVIFKTLKEVK